MNTLFRSSYVSENCGLGLFAISNLCENQVLFEEYPLISCQNSWSKFYKYAACDHCMKPLESVEENLSRLTEETTVNLPYQDHCQTRKLQENFVNCSNCNIAYCCQKCHDEAAELYHKVMCQGCRIGNSLDPLNILDEAWRKTHYPPETGTIMLLVRLAAIRISAESSNVSRDVIEALKPFIFSLSNSETGEAHKILRPEFMENLSMLHQCYTKVIENILLNNLNLTQEKVAIMFPNGQQELFLEYNSFLSVFCMLCRNQQGISTSPLSVWIKRVNAHLENGDNDVLQNFTKMVDSIYDKLDNTAGSFLDSEGVGLYSTQHLLNHSCDPNCEIVFSGEDNKLSVVCMRPISEGEEMTISYIDDCWLSRGRHSRRKYLNENYLFNCECAKCRSDLASGINLSETTSEEDETNSEMECG